LIGDFLNDLERSRANVSCVFGERA